MYIGLLRVLFEWIKSWCLFCIPNRYRFKDVSQDTVLITGGGSGIGRILAQKFAALGSRVIIVDVNEEGMKETASLITKSTKGSCMYYVCDVSNRQHVYTTAAKIRQEIGFVSILVNNAGITGCGTRFLDQNDDRIVKTMDVNALSQFWMTKAFLPEMFERDEGHVVFVSSYAGLIGGCNLADYCASKFAVMGLAEVLTLEIKTDGRNINTTAICPYLINTGLFQGAAGSKHVPTLTPEFAAGRIMDAIRLNQPILVLPQPLYLTLFIKTLIPVAAGFELYKALDGLSFMKGFTGRQKNNVTNNNLNSNSKK
jgi:all-trans-retinol dehydrogenase (NAD+)